MKIVREEESIVMKFNIFHTEIRLNRRRYWYSLNWQQFSKRTRKIKQIDQTKSDKAKNKANGWSTRWSRIVSHQKVDDDCQEHSSYRWSVSKRSQGESNANHLTNSQLLLCHYYSNWEREHTVRWAVQLISPQASVEQSRLSNDQRSETGSASRPKSGSYRHW